MLYVRTGFFYCAGERTGSMRRRPRYTDFFSFHRLCDQGQSEGAARICFSNRRAYASVRAARGMVLPRRSERLKFDLNRCRAP